MAKKLQGNPTEDRISALPKELRQYILSFLPTKDAISTAILSTVWRYDWLYLRKLVFDHCFFDKAESFYMLERTGKQELSLRYLDFLEHVITKRKVHEPIIPKLNLYLSALPELFPKINSFLSQLQVEKILKLRLCFDGYKTMINRDFLKSVLITKALSELYLDQGTLKIESSLMFPSCLRKVTLHGVHMGESEVAALMASCTVVESLCFKYCSGFAVLKVSALPKLKELIFSDQKNAARVDIDVPNLESLVYRLRNPGDIDDMLKYSDFNNLKKLVLEECDLAYFKGNCMVHLETLNLIGCINVETFGVENGKKLTTLELESCDITDDWINRCLLELSSLKVLRIAHCDLLANLNISLDCLRKLSLLGCKEMSVVDVQCPSLYKFTYVNLYNLIFLASKTTLSSTLVDLYLPYWNEHSTEHIKLGGWFKSLVHCQSLTLRAYFVEDLGILWKMRQSSCPPLFKVKHLNVLLNAKRASSQSLVKIVEPMIWLFPQLETMQLKLSEPASSMSVKFTLKNHTSSGVIGCGCYGSLPIHCWRHSVKNFLIQERKGFTDDYSLERFFGRVIT